MGERIAPPLQQQAVHFAHTSDGVTIAYSTHGQGKPILAVPSWVSHLEMEASMPHTAQFLDGLSDAGRRRLVRFDSRGNGLSDREVSDLSAGARALDIEAVVDHINADKVALMAWSFGAPPAIIYAATHPEKISHLIFYAGFARSGETDRAPVGRAMVDLIRAKWSIGAKAAIEFIVPGADKEIADATTAYFTAATSGATAAAIMEESLFHIDVREYLSRLTMPTLVLHRREDEAIPFELGRELAAFLPHAHFIPLRGNVHPPHFGDSGAILDAINDFLATKDGHPEQLVEQNDHAHDQHAHAEPTGGLQTILFTDMEESTGITQRLGDAGAQELVRIHNSIVRDALHFFGGSEIKHTGDGIMAAFPSAIRAVEAAIAIQKAGDEHARDHPTSPFQLRIGLNAGEPVAEDGDLFGTAVQLASRVCTHASPGQILASNVVRELSAGKRFLWSDLGRVALRGFDDPVRIYEVKWRS